MWFLRRSPYYYYQFCGCTTDKFSTLFLPRYTVKGSTGGIGKLLLTGTTTLTVLTTGYLTYHTMIYASNDSFESTSSSSFSSSSAVIPPKTNASLESLKTWNSGTMLEKLNRTDPTQIDPQRRVVAVLGITGAGKSSTANTLAGRLVKAFTLSGSITSVTQAVSFRDYTFLDIPWRVIDTPGLCDTNKSKDQIKEELLRLTRYTPHGITAFIVVVPRGRFTIEQENALKDLVAIFGEKAFTQFSLVAITSATDLSEGRNLLPRDVLIDEINNLPIHHYFRKFVEATDVRVVPVENRLDPARQISRMTLHQRILDIETLHHGKRYSTHDRFLTEGAVERITNAMMLMDKDTDGKDNGKSSSTVERVLQRITLGHCKQEIFRRRTDQRLILGIQCEINE